MHSQNLCLTIYILYIQLAYVPWIVSQYLVFPQGGNISLNYCFTASIEKDDMEQQQLTTGNGNMSMKRLLDACNSGLNEYKHFYTVYNFWREIGQTLDQNETF